MLLDLTGAFDMLDHSVLAGMRGNYDSPKKPAQSNYSISAIGYHTE